MRITTKDHTCPGESSDRPAGLHLLEVLLAAAIGVLLMAALYVAMQVQLDHARRRDAVKKPAGSGRLLRADE